MGTSFSQAMAGRLVTGSSVTFRRFDRREHDAGLPFDCPRRCFAGPLEGHLRWGNVQEGATMGDEPEPGTVLEWELRRRHWGREEALAELARTAREMGIRSYALSLRQLDRWLSGQVQVPRGPACRVTERLFGRPIEVLLGPATPSRPALTAPSRPAVGDGPLTRRAAAQARSHARTAATEVVDAVSIETLHSEVRRLARGYASTSPLAFLADLVETRDGAYRLLKVTRRPGDLADLYLIAGQVSGLAATTSWDLGDPAAADDLAAAAWTYAELCGHTTLRAWVRSVQATVAFWSGRPGEGLRLADDGLRYADGSAAVRLHAIGARAAVMLPGRAERAVAALRRAAEAREHDGGADAMSDGIGGEFGFSPARLALCSGAVHLGLGDGAQAARHSREALRLFEQTPAGERRWTVQHGALIDLATARAHQGDVGGAADALGPVLALEPARRTARLSSRLLSLRCVVSDAPGRPARVGRQLIEAIDDWSAEALVRAPLTTSATVAAGPDLCLAWVRPGFARAVGGGRPRTAGVAACPPRRHPSPGAPARHRLPLHTVTRFRVGEPATGKLDRIRSCGSWRRLTARSRSRAAGGTASAIVSPGLRNVTGLRPLTGRPSARDRCLATTASAVAGSVGMPNR
jgi:hypothetical protein